MQIGPIDPEIVLLKLKKKQTTDGKIYKYIIGMAESQESLSNLAQRKIISSLAKGMTNHP